MTLFYLILPILALIAAMAYVINALIASNSELRRKNNELQITNNAQRRELENAKIHQKNSAENAVLSDDDINQRLSDGGYLRD